MSNITEELETISQGSIAIKPFINTENDNMGLTKEGLVLFPGMIYEEQLACINKNGIDTYLTGLNEFSTSVQSIKDKKKKESRIKSIRETVAYLEAKISQNIIDPDDNDFWNKVKTVSPTNKEYWSNITLKVGNSGKMLDPIENVEHLILIKAIEEGGFTCVAKSYQDAMNASRPPKFYLDKEIETVKVKSQSKLIKNKAFAKLTEIYETGGNHLLYVTKVIDIYSSRYKKNTPMGIMYERLDEYISGNSFEKSAIKAAKYFLEIAEKDLGELKIRAIIKDAMLLKKINLKADGMLYYNKMDTMMGRNVEDLIEFMLNPLNKDVTDDIIKDIEANW